MTGFHEPIMEGLSRFYRRIMFLPGPKQSFIPHQSKKAALLQISERHCRFLLRVLCLGQSRINAEFRCKFLDCTVLADAKQPGCEVNGIPICPTTETVVALIQFQAGCVVIMEGAYSHSGPAHHNPESLSSLSRGNCCLDRFIHSLSIISLYFFFCTYLKTASISPFTYRRKSGVKSEPIFEKFSKYFLRLTAPLHLVHHLGPNL